MPAGLELIFFQRKMTPRQYGINGLIFCQIVTGRLPLTLIERKPSL